MAITAAKGMVWHVAHRELDWAIGAPSGSIVGSSMSKASLMALPSNARVPSIGSGIDPHQMMMNARAMPTTEFVDYSFVFVH